MDLSKYEERERPQRSKKNTRKWCKGKVGREHTTELVYRSHYGYYLDKYGCGIKKKFVRWGGSDRVWEDTWYCLHEVKCTKCGKVLEHAPRVCPLNVNNLKMYWTWR